MRIGSCRPLYQQSFIFPRRESFLPVLLYSYKRAHTYNHPCTLLLSAHEEMHSSQITFLNLNFVTVNSPMVSSPTRLLSPFCEHPFVSIHSDHLPFLSLPHTAIHFLPLSLFFNPPPPYHLQHSSSSATQCFFFFLGLNQNDSLHSSNSSRRPKSTCYTLSHICILTLFK